MMPEMMERTASIVGQDKQFRLSLTRRWGRGAYVLFCMLNPSTADGLTDDATIRKCIGFATRWGFNALAVVNLYAFRATKPRVLMEARYPVGDQNDATVHMFAKDAGKLVAAWGRNAPLKRGQEMVGLLNEYGPVYCLGRCKNGSPMHPLMVPYSKQLEL